MFNAKTDHLVSNCSKKQKKKIVAKTVLRYISFAEFSAK